MNPNVRVQDPENSMTDRKAIHRPPTRKLAFSLFVALAASLSGCRQDMNDQAKNKPLSRSAFFSDGAAARPPVEHTVAQDDPVELGPLITGLSGTTLATELPVPVDRLLLERGHERFNIYCSVCHGYAGEGDGVIVQRGFPTPPSLHNERLRQAPIGHFFDVMTRGYGVMYPYAARVDVHDRWAIAAYMRALQLSQHATRNDVPEANRIFLNEAKP